MNTTHQLVAGYLDDLSRMLGDLDPADRAEVLAGVREHVEASLAGRPGAGEADIRAVLAELGPPDAVAREAYADRPHRGAAATPAAPVPLTSRPWAPVAVALLNTLGLFLLVLVVGGMAGFVVSSSTSLDGSETTQVIYHSGSVLVAAATGLFLVLPLWIPAVVIVGVSLLWTARQKLLLVAVLPVAALLLGGLPEAGWALVGASGLTYGAWAAVTLAAVGGIVLLWRLTAAGLARARALTAVR